MCVTVGKMFFHAFLVFVVEAVAVELSVVLPCQLLALLGQALK